MLYRRRAAKFTFYKQREVVRRLRKNLDNTDHYINEQFPKEVSDKRKSLVPNTTKTQVLESPGLRVKVLGVEAF